MFQIEFGFYGGRNPRSFWKCMGVYACVCESKSWPLLFFVLQSPYSEWYPRPFWSQKCMPDCRKSHLIFQNFLGRPPGQTPALAPSALGSRLHPLTGPPFPKFLDPPLVGSHFHLWQPGVSLSSGASAREYHHEPDTNSFLATFWVADSAVPASATMTCLAVHRDAENVPNVFPFRRHPRGDTLNLSDGHFCYFHVIQVSKDVAHNTRVPAASFLLYFALWNCIWWHLNADFFENRNVIIERLNKAELEH